MHGQKNIKGVLLLEIPLSLHGNNGCLIRVTRNTLKH